MTRILAVLFLAASMLEAAVTLTLTGPATMRAGSFQTLTLTMSGGAAPLGLQFTLNTPSDSFAAVPAAGPIVAAASKILRCSPWANNKLTCSVVGGNATTIADGVIATYLIQSKTTATFPQVYSVPNQASESMTGSSLSIGFAAGAPPPPMGGSAAACDVNQDSIVDAEDLRLITNWMTGAEVVPTTIPQVTCDINADAVCDILDVLIVARYITSGGTCP